MTTYKHAYVISGLYVHYTHISFICQTPRAKVAMVRPPRDAHGYSSALQAIELLAIRGRHSIAALYFGAASSE
jgi:hypothetical protein